MASIDYDSYVVIKYPKMMTTHITHVLFLS